MESRKVVKESLVYELNEFDLQFLFKVQQELMKHFSDDTPSVLAKSSLLKKIMAEPADVHHYGEKYWADHVYREYEHRKKEEIDILEGHQKENENKKDIKEKQVDIYRQRSSDEYALGSYTEEVLSVIKCVLSGENSEDIAKSLNLSLKSVEDIKNELVQGTTLDELKEQYTVYKEKTSLN